MHTISEPLSPNVSSHLPFALSSSTPFFSSSSQFSGPSAWRKGLPVGSIASCLPALWKSMGKSFALASQICPLLRITPLKGLRCSLFPLPDCSAIFLSSSPKPLTIFLSRVGWKGLVLRKMNDDTPYSSVSGVCSGLRSSWIHPAEVEASSMSKSLVSRMLFSSTSDLVVWYTLAFGLSFRTTPSTFFILAESLPPSRSLLLSRMTLANSIWSIMRLQTVRSSCSEAPPMELSVRASMDWRTEKIVLLSTTVTIVSSRA
mmetsp:Transcript_40871/g.79585  ORF Transcript_40871/g.79585 Transcript_40871/m.79585 type:complete len:259 (+) Transcript_40871:465-1241(+)